MDVYEFLSLHAIPYTRYDHEPVYTCEQAGKLHIPGKSARTKNLFLRDRKGRRHILVTVGADKAVDIRSLEAQMDAKSLSFASADRMQKYLGLSPGSVTLLGVINDHECSVEVVVDRDLLAYAAMQCHPLVNTSTLVISMNDVMRILELTGHHPLVIQVPGREESTVIVS